MIEDGFVVGLATTTWSAVTGEHYVVVGSQDPDDGIPEFPGTVDEGCRHEIAFDEDAACRQALACFQAYAEGRGLNLYWRCEPVLDIGEGEYEGTCKVYMRVLVSRL